MSTVYRDLSVRHLLLHLAAVRRVCVLAVQGRIQFNRHLSAADAASAYDNLASAILDEMAGRLSPDARVDQPIVCPLTDREKTIETELSAEAEKLRKGLGLPLTRLAERFPAMTDVERTTILLCAAPDMHPEF